ncbi:MAG: histidinol-phosphate transaminase [Clostridia bacterium]|nr:histidinol-phosphate transaminase [Clostridia bacterium]
MSRFFSEKYAALDAYVPGEQPKDMQYIKLNTNESPFPPPAAVVEAAKTEAGLLHLYSDPECTKFIEKATEIWKVKKGQILATNGSDEILNFAFMAFCDQSHPIVFPDITYGFYKVFAELNGVPYETIPLKEDFSMDPKDYMGIGKNIVIANPNAPTGLALSVQEIEEIVKSNPNNVVIIDEAYVDFGAESCVPLIEKYDNLLVTQTFSKFRSLAGGRLGLGIAQESLIADLNTVKYSTNPYNVNRMTMMAGYAALCEDEYFQTNGKKICKTRAFVTDALRELGFEVLESKTNFVFARSSEIDGKDLYLQLKSKGILVRHFDKARIADFNRITIGTNEQMHVFLDAIKQILNKE